MEFPHPYLEKREFKRAKNRSKSWIFRCKECEIQVDDAVSNYYWYRNDIGQMFCSEQCACNHDEVYEFVVVSRTDKPIMEPHIHHVGGKLKREEKSDTGVAKKVNDSRFISVTTDHGNCMGCLQKSVLVNVISIDHTEGAMWLQFCAQCSRIVRDGLDRIAVQKE